MLKIKSDEYEVECSRCRGQGFIMIHSGPMGVRDEDGGTKAWCSWCNKYYKGLSPGTRKVKLVGMIPIQIFATTTCTYRVALKEYCIELGGWGCGKLYSHEETRSEKELADKIIQAYRDKILPDEIKNLLKEVPV